MRQAKEALQSETDDSLKGNFTLRSWAQVLYTSDRLMDLGVTINHWVHHRGQLTVYMRLNDIPVPSIYGLSADDKNFTVPK